MSCPYYWWNRDYACRKTGKNVDEDVYYRYCRNYSYDECPIYKQERSSDSSCYISTACIKARNLPDNCWELTVLRSFRDKVLRTTECGRADVEHYYAIAPRIVDAIGKRPDATDIFCNLYKELVLPCVELIEMGQYDKAYCLYRQKSLELEDKYI